MSFLNEELKHFKYEPAENYEEYFIDLLFDKGPDIVDELLSGGRMVGENNFETSRKHIEKRHMEMSEKEMVELALKTGQPQGKFLPEMDYEEVKDMLYTMLFEYKSKIANKFVYGDSDMKAEFRQNFEEPVGYGIDRNLNMVGTKTMFFSIEADDSPFSNTGFRITTAYPSVDKPGDNLSLIKGCNKLRQEYGITDQQMKRFYHNSKKRQDIGKEKGRASKQREDRRMTREAFSGR